MIHGRARQQLLQRMRNQVQYILRQHTGASGRTRAARYLTNMLEVQVLDWGMYVQLASEFKLDKDPGQP